MRRFSVSTISGGVRTLVGVAPLIFFPNSTPKLPHQKQVAKNTAIAINLITRFKGKKPEPYTRKYTATIEQIEREIDTLLGSAEKLRKNVTDDKPMDKLTLMERCLRHGLWNYKKEEGLHNFDEYQKWLVYTPVDESRLNLLRREAELKIKYKMFKERRQAENGPAISLPKFDWEKEYMQIYDREIVVEKRMRYHSLAVNTRERDEAAIEEVYKSYRKPIQDKRLDDLVELLENFKPVLAREAILQRLTIKHLEGQLSIWRYLDWCPEIRDRSELEVDNGAIQWWMHWEEKRLLQVRLRSKNEVAEVMSKNQSSELESKPSFTSTSKVTTDEGRDKLLREVLALQARINAREEEESPKEKGAQALKSH